MKMTDLNPTMKAITVITSVFILAIVFDPLTPSIFLLFIIAITLTLGMVPVKKWFLYFSPVLFVALSYMWVTVLFPRELEVASSSVLWEWGWVHITDEALMTGIALGLRVLCFAALSIMFILTTDPTLFVFSLMQQCKLPPKLAYGILAGYRFLPLLKDELAIIQKAHRVRGIGRARKLGDRVWQFRRYAIPLLASAIRKAERVAIAMESKGFTGSRDRTTYRILQVTWKDWLFLFLIVGTLFGIMFISWKLEYLAWYRGQL